MRPTVSPFKCGLRFAALLLPLLLLCGARALALDPGRELSQFSRQVWQTENGLPQNTVHAVIQTRDGDLSAATEEGLARFDGLGFVVFDKENTPQLKTNDIRSVMQDHAGALWLSTGEGLVRLAGGESASFTTEQGLPGDDVKLAFEDRARAIWVGPAAALAGGGVQALFEGGDGTLWVGTTDGLSRFREGKFLSLDAGDALAGVGVQAIEKSGG